MSTHWKEKGEKIAEILASLIQESDKGALIIAEGKKDVEALRILGVAAPIVSVKTGGKSFDEAFQEIELKKPSQVILLLDFDRRGQEGTSRLKRSLEQARIKVNLRFWKSLKAIVSREVHCIEGLPSYLATLKSKSETA